jgi:hypothetical protein
MILSAKMNPVFIFVPFCSPKKVPKNGAGRLIPLSTKRDPGGALIKLLHYCSARPFGPDAVHLFLNFFVLVLYSIAQSISVLR